MSTKLGASSDTAELMTHEEVIYLDDFDQQTDADGRFFYSGEFVSTKADKNRCWRWKLLRSGHSLYNFCIESHSDRPVTLSSVVLYGNHYSVGDFVLLTKKKNIGQPTYQSADFSVAYSVPDFDEAFTHHHGEGIDLEIELQWTESEVSAVPMSSDGVLEGLYAKVIDGGDSMYELVSSDDQSFSVSIPILERKSAYFARFFATEGWKEQTEGRTVLVWTSAVVKQLIRYIYLNNTDGDVCELLPDVLDAAQMWELIGMKSVIEEQMKQRLEKAARDADTDTAVEYLKMAHLHNLASLVPICNDVLADNYYDFFDSECCKQMINSSEFSHLVKAVFYHKRNTNN